MASIRVQHCIEAGNMSRPDKRTICVMNNAEWCDAVCRALGVPGNFTPDIWLQPKAGPPYYSNAITLSRTGLAQQYAAIVQLGAALPEGFSVKDAFDSLDLTNFGFRILFDAQWMWFDQSVVTPRATRDSSWSQVETEDELVRWEAAWAAAGSPTTSRVFLPTLLTDSSLAFFRTEDNDQIVAGCIANRSRAQVVGFSNFFAIDSDRDRYRSEAVTVVSDFAKGNPVVGYDRGAELIALQALGFHSVGSLRVWLRS
jgi:hypothetical protein